MELQLVSHNSAPNFEAPERWNCSRSSADMNWLILVQIIVTTYLGVLTSTTEGFHLKSLSIFVPAHKTPSNNISAGAWGNFSNLINAQKGYSAEGMGELKQYFRMFGYLNHVDNDNNITECYDEIVESAVKLYQQSFGLPVTGNLDTDTLSQIMMPRCGVQDIVNGTSSMFNDGNYRGNGNGNGLHTTKHYTFFGGKPKWPLSERNLTYAFSPAKEVAGITKADLRTVFSRAFNRWSAVIPVNFTLIEDYSSANIKIGFFSGNHGDHEPFDGVLGTLAHAFSPQDGRLHLDAAESWTIRLEEDNSRIAIDLESVATHEIGHILGLGHSAVKEAIMYPSIPPRTRKKLNYIVSMYVQSSLESNAGFCPPFSRSKLPGNMIRFFTQILTGVIWRSNFKVWTRPIGFEPLTSVSRTLRILNYRANWRKESVADSVNPI